MNAVVEKLDNYSKLVCRIQELEKCAAKNSEEIDHHSKRTVEQQPDVEQQSKKENNMAKKLGEQSLGIEL